MYIEIFFNSENVWLKEENIKWISKNSKRVKNTKGFKNSLEITFPLKK